MRNKEPLRIGIHGEVIPRAHTAYKPGISDGKRPA
jgi:hypothetical protein